MPCCTNALPRRDAPTRSVAYLGPFAASNLLSTHMITQLASPRTRAQPRKSKASCRLKAGPVLVALHTLSPPDTKDTCTPPWKIGPPESPVQVPFWPNAIFCESLSTSVVGLYALYESRSAILRIRNVASLGSFGSAGPV